MRDYMRILWSVNTLSPMIASQLNIKSLHSISWVDAMSNRLKDRNDVVLAIASPGNVNELRKSHMNGIEYYILPNTNKIKNAWQEVISNFSPDIIHIYGTERQHNLSLVDFVSNRLPIIVSLQGIIAEYEKHYYGGISRREILKYYTLGDIFLRQGIFSGKKKFVLQKKLEAEILKNISYVEGRSDWDRVMSEQINPNRKYYSCPRMIRPPFFETSWDETFVEPHTLFMHQGAYPIKGLHFMMKALHVLKRKYPDVKLYISGVNFLRKATGKRRLTETGYTKYIRSMIKKYDIEENIVFTGYLSATELAERLSSVQACVVPSVIENAPNSLAEGMIVGTPCIASYVGGNAEMLDNGLGGYLYRYNEFAMLADRISYVFENPEDARCKSCYAKEFARRRHDPETLEKTIMNIYQDVIADFSGR